MPFYYRLRRNNVSSEDRIRTVEGLQRLREQLRAELPARTVKKSLLLATWNIRDLGNEDKRFEPGTGPGPRFEESYYYIAEIISSFDLVALQEVNSLEALQKIMRILGPSWDYMTTDVTRTVGGNNERMTFVYDKRKILFQNVVGQVVTDDDKQFVRTPFYASFQAGWFRFTLCTVHILYGDWKDTTERVAEIDRIAKTLVARSEATGENMILLGDFNIISQEDATFAPLTDNGWYVPLDFDTNVMKSKSYDQIAFYVNEEDLENKPRGGVFEFFKSVYRGEDLQTYYELAGKLGRPLEPWDNTPGFPDKTKTLSREQYYERNWRTWQMSDHMPLWTELEIDFTDAYLEKTKGWGCSK